MRQHSNRTPREDVIPLVSGSVRGSVDLICLQHPECHEKAYAAGAGRGGVGGTVFAVFFTASPASFRSPSESSFSNAAARPSKKPMDGGRTRAWRHAVLCNLSGFRDDVHALFQPNFHRTLNGG